MAEVEIDGERVNFEGPPPGTALEVWTLIENFLGQSELIIDRFLVDGVAWDSESGEDVDRYEKIEIYSISQERNLYNTVLGLIEHRNQLLEQWNVGARASLSTPWAAFQSQAMDIFMATQPIVQFVALLSEYAKQRNLVWAEALSEAGEGLNIALSSAIDAFDSANCIRYSDAAAVDVLSTLKRVYQVFSEEVLRSLDSKENQ